MTTPPSRLIAKLSDFCLSERPGLERSGAPVLIDVRSAQGVLEERVSPAQAIAYAIRGTVEGVGPPSGAIRYLRKLVPAAMQPAPKTQRAEESYVSGSSAVARTNLGVYRQEIVRSCDPAAVDEYGISTRVVIGWVYAHCALRGL